MLSKTWYLFNYLDEKETKNVGGWRMIFVSASIS